MTPEPTDLERDELVRRRAARPGSERWRVWLRLLDTALALAALAKDRRRAEARIPPLYTSLCWLAERLPPPAPPSAFGPSLPADRPTDPDADPTAVQTFLRAAAAEIEARVMAEPARDPEALLAECAVVVDAVLPLIGTWHARLPRVEPVVILRRRPVPDGRS